MNTVLIIIAVLLVAAAVYYFGFYKRGKINDQDGDFIPDEIEDAYIKAEDFVEDAVEDILRQIDKAEIKLRKIFFSKEQKVFDKIYTKCKKKYN